MNLAEQMYQRSQDNQVKEIDFELLLHIKEKSEGGITKLEIDDEDYFYYKSLNSQEALKLNGFKIEYDTDFDFGQVPTQYIIISWNLYMDKEKQQFQLGDTAYMIDDDYRFFESEVYKIELDNGSYYYTTDDCDFESNDIGNWVFTSELYRQIHMENMSEMECE